MNQSKKSQYLESHLQSNETTTTDTRSTSLVRCLFYRDKINVGKKSWWQEICLYMSWKVMVRYFSECKLNYYDIPLEQIALRMFGNKENDKDESIDSRINSRTITYWHPSFPSWGHCSRSCESCWRNARTYPVIWRCCYQTPRSWY